MFDSIDLSSLFDDFPISGLAKAATSFVQSSQPRYSNLNEAQNLSSGRYSLPLETKVEPHPTKAATSADPKELMAEWYARLNRYSQIVSETKG